MISDVPALIVDDYREMIRLLRRILVELGFSDVAGASDGLSALAKMREKDFGLVLVDCNMAPMGGLELIRTMRSDEKLSSIPVIVISAIGDERTIREAADLNIDGYILKPFSKRAVAHRLSQLEGSGGLTEGGGRQRRHLA